MKFTVVGHKKVDFLNVVLNRAVKEILSLLQLHRYQTFIQLFPNGEIAPYNPNHHTPEIIAAYDNPHLFGRPKK